MTKTASKPLLVAARLERERVPSFDAHPFDLPLVRQLDTIELKPVTFFVGENVTRKSTLFEEIAIGLRLNAKGGSRDFNFSSAVLRMAFLGWKGVGVGVGGSGRSGIGPIAPFVNPKARIDVIGRGWEEPAGKDSNQNRRVEVQWFTLE